MRACSVCARATYLVLIDAARLLSFFFVRDVFVCVCSICSGALSYFGEDPELTPQEFFTTLHSFIQVCFFSWHCVICS